MKTKLVGGLMAAIILCVSAAAAEREPLPLVSPIFGDNMVLQRGKPNAIWGWAKPGDEVRVEIAGQKARAVAAVDGRWELKIKPPAPGGPYTLRIEGTQPVELHEILVGDVWLCGGQSNMELPFGAHARRQGGNRGGQPSGDSPVQGAVASGVFAGADTSGKVEDLLTADGG